MNRFTITVALSVAVASLASVGCAAGVEDQQPEETVEAQRPPPAQLRTGVENGPLANVVGSVDDLRVDLRVPLKQPIPGPQD